MSEDPSAPDGADESASLMAHLLELRARLLRAVLGVVLVFVALLPFADTLYTCLLYTSPSPRDS